MRSPTAPMLLLLASTVLAHAQVPARPNLAAWVDQNCIDCHGSGRKRGDLSLEGLDFTRPADRPDIWEKVLRKLEHRQMPPIEEPRPAEAEYRDMARFLTAELDRVAAA